VRCLVYAGEQEVSQAFELMAEAWAMGLYRVSRSMCSCTHVDPIFIAALDHTLHGP
jgi:hypothetical protein